MLAIKTMLAADQRVPLVRWTEDWTPESSNGDLLSQQQDMDPGVTEKSTEQFRRLLSLLLLGLLLAAFYIICRPFLRSLTWAAIVVLGAWPFHSRLRRRWPRWPGLTAASTTLLMTSILILLAVPIAKGLGPELKSAGEAALAFVTQQQDVLESRLAGIPLVGERLSQAVGELKDETADLVPLIQNYAKTVFGTATVAAQGVLSFVFQAGVFAMAVFFFLYYGEEFSNQVRSALLKMDPRTESLLTLVQNTVTGVLYGLVFTALAQGFLAGIGFAVAGVRAPTVLGLATAFLSFVPYGPQAVYLPVSLSLALNGSPVAGVLLALWGILVVSSADNVLKPMFISRQVRMPLPLSLLGVTGGLLGFGLLGVFIGPVVMGLVQNLWLAWTEEVSVADEEAESAPVALEPDGESENQESAESPE